MITAPIINMGNVVISNSKYSPEFFEKLFQKIGLTTQSEKYALKQTIKLATDAYLTHCDNHDRELPAHEIKDKLEKSLKHINKATEYLNQVYKSQYYSEAVINNLSDVIYREYPTLHNLPDEMVRNNDFGEIISPRSSLVLLSAMADGIKQALENFEYEKTPNKSEALYNWVMVLSGTLEPLLGRNLEQSRYYKGEYISKRETSDSDLLLFIIEPLDPDVTISQLETAIKKTHKERREAPWNDYF